MPPQLPSTPRAPPPSRTSRRTGDRALGLLRRLAEPSSSPSSIVATPGWREEPPNEAEACTLCRASGEAASRSLSGVLAPASLSSTSLPVLDTLRRMGSSADSLQTAAGRGAGGEAREEGRAREGGGGRRRREGEY